MDGRSGSLRLAIRMVLTCTIVVAVVASPMLASASAGAIDPTFGSDGWVFYSDAVVPTSAFDVDRDPSGNLVVAAWIDGPVVLRFDPDGSFDPSFGTLGRVEIPFTARALGVAGSRIVVAGRDGRSLAVMALTLDGRTDPTFGAGGIATLRLGRRAAVTAIEPTADGGWLLGGNLLVGRSGRRNHGFVARLSATGAPDVTLAGRGWLPTARPVAGIVPTADAGFAFSYTDIEPSSASSVAVVERRRPDGSLDPAFSDDGIERISASRWGTAAGDLVVDASGRLVVLTRFEGCGFGSVLLVRFRPDGRIDHAFGRGGTRKVRCIPYGPTLRLDPEGRIVIAGSSQGAGSGELVVVVNRLTPDGDPDRSFGEDGRAAGSYDSEHYAYVTDVEIQPDAAIVVLGYDSYNYDRPTHLTMVRFLGA